jgi:hypothetical protein
MDRRPHPDLLLRRRPSEHSPHFSEILIMVWVFEIDERSYSDDVVVMKFGLVMQHRLLSLGEEEGC